MNVDISLTEDEYLATVYILESVRTAYIKSNKRASITLRDGEQQSVALVLKKLRQKRISATSIQKVMWERTADEAMEWKFEIEGVTYHVAYDEARKYEMWKLDDNGKTFNGPYKVDARWLKDNKVTLVDAPKEGMINE
jgi:hypothetical protein